LVPFEVGTSRGGAPFNVSPNSTQGVWVDVYIAKDAVPGRYNGILRVLAAGSTYTTIPITLDVYSFALSDTTHFHNYFYTSPFSIAEEHGIRWGSQIYYDVEREYYKMAHRHRMDLSFNQTLDSLDRRAKGYYTGEFYSKAYDYEGLGAASAISHMP